MTRPLFPPPALRIAAAAACAGLAALASCSKPAEQHYRTYKTPEDAVHALNGAVAKGDLAEVRAIFGPEAQQLIDESDPVVARQNRQVYTVAVREGWRLVDEGERKELVIGNEAWPFPVPLIEDAGVWRFDTTAGVEEVLARRIGRNELNAIRTSQAYVAAQRRYARDRHDGKPPGLYAQTFASHPGRHNGLYWAAARGEPRSPLGELLQEAEAHGGTTAGNGRATPFHGYYFRILTAQGDAAPGGARSYLAGHDMSGGFALVAWPAQYERTGIMTFIVNHDGVVHEKDLGPQTDVAVRMLKEYNPDDSWSPVR
jgi:hypothetical protein